jgi:ribose/xylose/arabinose/galactoside ABC-type transport system permease subunit
LPVIFLAAQNPRLLSVRNSFNILTDGSFYGVMAVGMTLGSTSR